MRIVIPRWAQMVLIPLVVLLGVYFSRVFSNAIFIFLVAFVLAMLLNPLVAALQRLRIPRGLGTTIVYLSFAAVVVLGFVFGGPLLYHQAQNLVAALPGFGESLQNWLAGLQEFLSRYGIDVNLQTDRIVDWLQTTGLGSISTFLNIGVDLVGWVVDFVLIVIISLYMLIDGARIRRWFVGAFPWDSVRADLYFSGLQSSFIKFIKGQTLLAAAVGMASGLGIWIFGWDLVGLWPEGSQYAALFGVWAGLTEVIPYIGPWLGAAPPVALALFHSPLTGLWVALLFLVIQQLENHILVPNIMGSSVGVHPLIVIFTLLAASQVRGLLGMLLALPLLAMLKHTMDFFQIRFSHAPWIADDGIASMAIEQTSAKRGPPVSVSGSVLAQETGSQAKQEPDERRDPAHGDS